ncbi:MAG TPA: phosphotransferase [Candidatus Limnocylindrales bacterium]|nr:phosphotransferase [Candidatus Limnocylindrales bacterium]
MNELVGAVLTRPSIDTAGAASVLLRQWGLVGDLRSLPSERDRNFAVVVDGVERFVLKLSNANEDPAFLDFQHRVMDRLAGAGVPCQRAIRTTAGREIVDIGSDGSPILARLLGWLPGRPLAAIPSAHRSSALLTDLGRTMGRTAAALDGFDHPAAHRRFHWSAEQSLEVIAAHAPAITDPDRVALLDRWRRRLEPLAAILPALRHGVIHNDANDHNVLVADDGASISGLLDLGDAVWSVVVNELAVACAYAALGDADPVATIETVRSGFEEALPLADDERDLLVELVALRLATSVALSAHQSSLAPDDPYLTVSEAPAWDLLERLIAVEPVR